MAAPHPGKWERLLNQTQCLLSTTETAVHACVLVNPAVQKRWKVVMFYAGQSELENLKSAVWNPFATSPVSIQDIPAWPVQPNPLPRLFLRAKNQSLSGQTAIPSIAYIVRVTDQS